MNSATFIQMGMVAGGAALGGVLRYLFSIKLQGLPFSGHGFPWGTFAVNILGCLFIGLSAAYLIDHEQISDNIKLFLMTGVLGGFTTFSAFSIESLYMLQYGHFVMASGYVFGSLFIGISASLFGFLILKSIL